jgi:Ca2+-binding EF-hand superfamily protein
VDKSGAISLKELSSSLKNVNYHVSAEEIHTMFESIDKDGSGLISLKEFKIFMQKMMEEPVQA